MKHLLQKQLVTITLHIVFALPGTEVCIYFFVFLSILTSQLKILYPQRPFRYSQKSVSVRFGTQRVRFGTQRVRFGIHESPFRSVPVRFGIS